MLQDSWGQPVEECGTHPLSAPDFTGHSIVPSRAMWSPCVRFARMKHRSRQAPNPKPPPRDWRDRFQRTPVSRESAGYTPAPPA